MKKYAIGADIGGSHITAAVIDTQSKKILRESILSESVDNKGSCTEILEAWGSVLNRLVYSVERDQLAGIAFAMPGPFDYFNGTALFKGVDKFEGLYNVNISQALKGLVGDDIDFRFVNDASAFAIGEAWKGKVSYFRKIIAITLGTGFGSAFMDNGVPVLEGELVPSLGCLWHLPYKNGIADDHFSTRWFTGAYGKITGKMYKGVKQISEDAKTDVNAQALFAEFGYNLGSFLVPWIKKFSAEAIVIGGNQTKGYQLFGPSMESAFLKEGLSPQIHLSAMLEDAALLGAARLFENNYYEHILPLLSKM